MMKNRKFPGCLFLTLALFGLAWAYVFWKIRQPLEAALAVGLLTLSLARTYFLFRRNPRNDALTEWREWSEQNPFPTDGGDSLP